MLRIVQEPIPSLEEYVTDAPPQLNSVLSRALAKRPRCALCHRTRICGCVYRSDSCHQQSSDCATPTHTNRYRTKYGKIIYPRVTKLNTDSNPTGQMVIVQQSTNPFVLLGGFAIIAIALVVLVVILTSGNNSFEITIGGTAPPTNTTSVIVATRPTIQTFGRVNYTTTNSLGDTANIRVDNLQLSGNGVYMAWLINTATDAPPLNVGELTLDALGSATLRYVDEWQ